jgi:hypothetical protein
VGVVGNGACVHKRLNDDEVGVVSNGACVDKRLNDDYS